MLPSEASLLAAGKTRPVLKRLWHGKRCERGLLSYERIGWLEDEPSNVLNAMEVRPSGNQGPIIVCLDTSASMSGGREKIAKAVVLECIRGARIQRRKCFVYAFSGRDEVMELDLSSDCTDRKTGNGEGAASLVRLLDFLEHSFDGGTDVNEPLRRSLNRLKNGDPEWSRADILMVTDGEIPTPEEQVLQDLAKQIEEDGLQVSGLLVGPRRSQTLNDLCTNVHRFDDWSVV